MNYLVGYMQYNLYMLFIISSSFELNWNILTVKPANKLWFRLLRSEGLLEKTRHIVMSPWALGNCDSFSVFLSVVENLMIEELIITLIENETSCNLKPWLFTKVLGEKSS